LKRLREKMKLLFDLNSKRPQLRNQKRFSTSLTNFIKGGHEHLKSLLDKRRSDFERRSQRCLSNTKKLNSRKRLLLGSCREQTNYLMILRSLHNIVNRQNEKERSNTSRLERT
jgi:hypothetical protein